MKKIISIDLGTKLNGIAICDELLISTRSLNDFKKKNILIDSIFIIIIIIINKAGILIIGSPSKNFKNNQITKKAKKMKLIINKIKTKIKLKLIIKIEDEILTTNEAINKYKNKKNINSKAAEILLIDFINNKKNE